MEIWHKASILLASALHLLFVQKLTVDPVLSTIVTRLESNLKWNILYLFFLFFFFPPQKGLDEQVSTFAYCHVGCDILHWIWVQQPDDWSLLPMFCPFSDLSFPSFLLFNPSVSFSSILTLWLLTLVKCRESLCFIFFLWLVSLSSPPSFSPPAHRLLWRPRLLFSTASSSRNFPVSPLVPGNLQMRWL